MGEISWWRAFNYAASFVLYVLAFTIIGSVLLAVGLWLSVRALPPTNFPYATIKWGDFISGVILAAVGFVINSLAAIAVYFKLMSRLIPESSASSLTSWKGASFCPNCGKKLLPIATIVCPFCGFNLGEAAQTRQKLETTQKQREELTTSTAEAPQKKEVLVPTKFLVVAYLKAVACSVLLLLGDEMLVPILSNLSSVLPFFFELICFAIAFLIYATIETFYKKTLFSFLAIAGFGLFWFIFPEVRIWLLIINIQILVMIKYQSLKLEIRDKRDEDAKAHQG